MVNPYCGEAMPKLKGYTYNSTYNTGLVHENGKLHIFVVILSNSVGITIDLITIVNSFISREKSLSIYNLLFTRFVSEFKLPRSMGGEGGGKLCTQS